MKWFPIVAAGLLGVLLVGTLLITGGQAIYLRSGAYRAAAAEILSDRIGLPSDIGAVVPRSLSSREFRDIVVWLPERRGQALVCESATVLLTPRPDDSEAYELHLRGGACEISTRSWLRSDYRDVVESGLRPGFMPGGPDRVVFREMDLTIDRSPFRAEFDDASGEVVFTSRTRGHAHVACRMFNRFRCLDPILARVEFAPENGGVRIERLDLALPRLPLAIVRLNDLVGLQISGGEFSGGLRYEESDRGRKLTASGQIHGLNLVELTSGLLPRPVRGACDEAELLELTVEDGQPRLLRFRGVLRDVQLGDLLSIWGAQDVGGVATLRVDEAVLSPNGIDRLAAVGHCAEASLSGLSALFGPGRINGRLRVTIDSLEVENNRVKSLDAVLRVEEGDDPPRWIDRALILSVTERLLNTRLPEVVADRLPERVEYTQLGVRLQVRDEDLYILGAHGPRERTILTVRLFGREFPLLQEPGGVLDLRPTFDHLRREMFERLMWHIPQDQRGGRSTGDSSDTESP